jgi:ABC-type arginine transport system ATPase subunit
MSIRLAVARQTDGDRDAVERAASYDDAYLIERHRLVVALADALMTQPGQLDDELIAGLRAEFTAAQLVEITLKTMKYNVQKVLVALGTDEPITPERINQVSWNQDGTYVVADAHPRR